MRVYPAQKSSGKALVHRSQGLELYQYSLLYHSSVRDTSARVVRTQQQGSSYQATLTSKAMIMIVIIDKVAGYTAGRFWWVERNGQFWKGILRAVV